MCYIDIVLCKNKKKTFSVDLSTPINFSTLLIHSIVIEEIYSLNVPYNFEDLETQISVCLVMFEMMEIC